MSDGRKYQRSEVPWLVLGALIGVVFVLPFVPVGETDARIVATILGCVGGCALVGVAIGQLKNRRRT